VNTAQQLTQQINQAIQKIEKEKVILEAEFINATPWWGKGPTGKMIENINGKRIYSLPTAKTIIGKTRWVMATYLSPYCGMKRKKVEKIIAQLLGSTKRASLYRVIVDSTLVINEDKNTKSNNQDVHEIIRNEGKRIIINDITASLAAVSNEEQNINEEMIPFAPGYVNLKIIVSKRIRDEEIQDSLIDMFVILSMFSALIVYGIGSRANRGYGRFILRRMSSRYEHLPVIVGRSVEEYLVLLKLLDMLARELAHMSCDKSHPAPAEDEHKSAAMWPVSHVSSAISETVVSAALQAIELKGTSLTPEESIGVISTVTHWIRKGVENLPSHPLEKAQYVADTSGGVLEIFAKKVDEETLSKVIVEASKSMGMNPDEVMQYLTAITLKPISKNKEYSLSSDDVISYIITQYVMGLPEKLENLEKELLNPSSSLLTPDNIDLTKLLAIYKGFYYKGKVNQILRDLVNELCSEIGLNPRKCSELVSKLAPLAKWAKTRRQSSIVFTPICSSERECIGFLIIAHYANDIALLLDILEKYFVNDPMILEKIKEKIIKMLFEFKRAVEARRYGLINILILLIKVVTAILMLKLGISIENILKLMGETNKINNCVVKSSNPRMPPLRLGLKDTFNAGILLTKVKSTP